MNKESIILKTIDEVKLVGGGKSEFNKVLDFLRMQIVLVNESGLNGQRKEIKKGKLRMWSKRVFKIENDNREYRILKIYLGLCRLKNSKQFVVLNDEKEVVKVIESIISICENKGNLSFLIK